MRWVGEFRELFDDRPELPSLHDAVGRLDPADAPIADYLRDATPLAVTASFVYDQLDKAHPLIGNLAELTDGEWAWRSDFAYYVAKYSVDVPAELVVRARARGWVPPALSDDDLSRLEEELLGPTDG